jgi:DNA-binding response OmpR family regulator
MTAYVLIVDDDFMNRELLEAYLKLGGYRVGQANSGEKALGMIQAERPDLVMLDIRLSGLSGLEVCRQIKNDERTRAIPVVMVSGLESDEDRMQAARIGANGFVAKPYDLETILTQIAALLKDSSA